MKIKIKNNDEEFKEREEGKDFIKAIIYVERDSQKGIIIGENGKAIKRVGVMLEGIYKRP